MFTRRAVSLSTLLLVIGLISSQSSWSQQRLALFPEKSRMKLAAPSPASR